MNEHHLADTARLQAGLDRVQRQSDAVGSRIRQSFATAPRMPAAPDLSRVFSSGPDMSGLRAQALKNTRADREAIYAKHGLTLPPD
jgi:hypothetical protein